MDSLETPYEVEVPIDFIDCPICNKSIRDETLYKIHLTTAGHLKKEEALVAEGRAFKEHIVPDFVDIVQYLQYLNLDEPIIGLNYLLEVPRSDVSDPQPGPTYLCKLCSLEANLPNMVNHIIGRKHRQKYLQTQRKDLVKWDTTTVFNQPAKVIRAKAEVVERQDGRGTPTPMAKRAFGKLNIAKVPKRKKNENLSQSDAQQGVPPKRNNYEIDYFHQSTGSSRGHNTPPFHQNDRYMAAEDDGNPYFGEDPRRRELIENGPQRAAYMENYSSREFTKGDYPQEYQVDCTGDGYRKDFLEEDSNGWPEPMKGMPHRRSHHEDPFPEEDQPYNRPYLENDPLKQFYSEEVKRERARATRAVEPGRRALHGPRGQGYPDGDCHRYSYPSEDAEPHYLGTGPRGQAYPLEEPSRGSSEVYPEDVQPSWTPEKEARREETYDPVNNRRFAEPMGSDQSYHKDHMFERDGGFCETRRGPGEAVGRARAPEGARDIPDIPEAFRRFLQGPSGSQGNSKRKKSRFSDASKEEMETAMQMLMDSNRSPSLEAHRPARPVYRPTQPEVHRLQKSNPYADSKGLYNTDSHARGNMPSENTGSEVVFDLLKNIEIENVEEADFLKNKLCSVLKEFQAKKSKYTNQVLAVQSRDYSSMIQEQQASPQSNYERTRLSRDDSDRRSLENQPWRVEEHYSQEVHRGRGWEDGALLLKDRYQEYRQPDAERTNRSHYEEVFGPPKSPHPPPAPYPQEQLHPGRLQENMQLCEYPPAPEGFFHNRSRAPPVHREQGFGFPRGPQNSSSLDKITSTLLQLVARK